MHRLLSFAALAAVLVIVGCGSNNSNTVATAGAPGSMSSVGVKHVDGVGDVLVDSSGLALYSPDQEAGGKIQCTGQCVSFWLPVKAGSSTPPKADGVAKLAVVHRPDGTRQVAVDGKPLYTFVQDAPGKITGDGFKDSFGGHAFTWHVVLADGGSSDGGSAGSTGGGYGY
jgi:predicted lipoprotein with Yx(FWY)xxD motif